MARRWIATGLLTLALLAWHVEAQASCTQHTYFVNGRMVMCTTCFGGNCTTTCL